MITILGYQFPQDNKENKKTENKILWITQSKE